jgi:hypothetical protein
MSSFKYSSVAFEPDLDALAYFYSFIGSGEGLIIEKRRNSL